MLGALGPIGPQLHVPTVIDLAAVVVGALSGAVLAARERLAATGVLVLAFSTGLGGGVIRDVILDSTPTALTNRLYLPTVAAAAVAAFFFASALSRLTPVLLALDALTLGLFTVIGAEKAQFALLPAPSVVFLGVVTAVGGGVVRDVFLGAPPDVVRPGPMHALASLAGGLVLVVLAGPVGAPSPVVEAGTIAVTTGLRLLALWRRWEAPVPVDLPGMLLSADLVPHLPVRPLLWWQRRRAPDRSDAG